MKGTGAIQYVKTWGVPGRSEIWTGLVSGKTADRGVVQEVVNCEIAASSVSPEDGKYVAITFDEGPSSYTSQIVDILKEKGVEGHVFPLGRCREANAAAAKTLADAGMELGSNSYSDTDLSKMSGDELRQQIQRGFDAIKSATGEDVHFAAGALRHVLAGELGRRPWICLSAVVSWTWTRVTGCCRGKPDC